MHINKNLDTRRKVYNTHKSLADRENTDKPAKLLSFVLSDQMYNSAEYK